MSVPERRKHVLEYSSATREEREERRLLEKERQRRRELQMFPLGDGGWTATTVKGVVVCMVLEILLVWLLPGSWRRIVHLTMALAIVSWVSYRAYRRYQQRFPW